MFKQISREAAAHPNQRYLLIVDEINRANLAKVFGELITLLEKDKRGLTVTLPQSKESFTIPDNVYLLGTMNTADRSIKLMDAALRRRFAFLELMPDVELLHGASAGDLALDQFLSILNRRIAARVGREKQIGHAFLLDRGQPVAEISEFARRFRQEILPLLQEYCYDDYRALSEYLAACRRESQRPSLQLAQVSKWGALPLFGPDSKAKVERNRARVIHSDRLLGDTLVDSKAQVLNAELLRDDEALVRALVEEVRSEVAQA